MYSNDKVILESLSEDDADYFQALYSHPKLTVNFDESPFLSGETPRVFTKRIISLCEFIFTIRPKESPDLIMDCALHHWDKQQNEIVIGGLLFSDYWGKGFMQAAFELLTEIVKEELHAKALLGQTKTKNLKAIKFIEKIGYELHRFDHTDTIMRKEL